LGCGETPSLTDDLNWLENRFHAFSQSFPHEIGLFLGYPLKDVEGFIRNQQTSVAGRTLWRVFGEPTESLALMQRFRSARVRLARALQREPDAERFCLRLNRRQRFAS
jgi:hypothetical protein